MNEELLTPKPTLPRHLDEDHKKLVAALNSEANREQVVNIIRDSLAGHADNIIDQYTDYLRDEYALVLNDITIERAGRLVCELLKGNREVAQSFGLITTTDLQGKEVSYDFDGVRRAIFEKFKVEIVNAEVVSLREENSRLKERVNVLTETRERY